MAESASKLEGMLNETDKLLRNDGSEWFQPERDRLIQRILTMLGKVREVRV